MEELKKILEQHAGKPMKIRINAMRPLYWVLVGSMVPGWALAFMSVKFDMAWLLVVGSILMFSGIGLFLAFYTHWALKCPDRLDTEITIYSKVVKKVPVPPPLDKRHYYTNDSKKPKTTVKGNYVVEPGKKSDITVKIEAAIAKLQENDFIDDGKSSLAKAWKEVKDLTDTLKHRDKEMTALNEQVEELKICGEQAKHNIERLDEMNNKSSEQNVMLKKRLCLRKGT
jgi:hypothetical protein